LSCSWFEEDFGNLAQATEASKAKFKNKEELQAKIEDCLRGCLNQLMEICYTTEIKVPIELSKAQSVTIE
jgi:hypothetical protein